MPGLKKYFLPNLDEFLFHRAEIPEINRQFSYIYIRLLGVDYIKK
jgi:hypothetical protein